MSDSTSLYRVEAEVEGDEAAQMLREFIEDELRMTLTAYDAARKADTGGTETDERVITVRGGGPTCPGCGGGTFEVAPDGSKPWWCPDCNVRFTDDGEYGAAARFPAGSKPEGESS